MISDKKDMAVVHQENDTELKGKSMPVDSGDVANQEARAKIERRIVRKLDMTVMPMVWSLYLFNYLDRNNIAQAKLNGIEDDLGLVGDQFNTAISILNVG